MTQTTIGLLTWLPWEVASGSRQTNFAWKDCMPLPNVAVPAADVRAEVQPALTGVHFVPVRKAGKPTKWYVYARRNGPRIKTSHGEDKPPLTSEDIQRIHLAREHDANERANQNLMTLRRLAEAWQASNYWRRMTPNSERTCGSALRSILGKFGQRPAVLFYDDRMVPHIYEWRKQLAEHPRATDTKMSTLRSLLDFGCGLLGFSNNIAVGIPRLYAGNTRPEIIWTKQDIDRFVVAARNAGKPALAMAILLAAETGLRRADLVKLRRCHIKDGVITLKASKPSRGKCRYVSIPILPSLEALLNEIKALPRKHGATTILVDDDGRPWEPERLTSAFRRMRNKLNIVHVEKKLGQKPIRRLKNFHDLRGTFATKLVLEGHSDADIADVLGWTPAKAARIRTTYVPQGTKARSMAARMQRGPVSLATRVP